MHSELITYLLGGGLVTSLIGILTLRSRIKKISGETAAIDLQNTNSATHILIENIVEPLKSELNETRKEFNATKHEMQLLRRAIQTANSCRYYPSCPVLNCLREHPKDCEPS